MHVVDRHGSVTDLLVNFFPELAHGLGVLEEVVRTEGEHPRCSFMSYGFKYE